MILLAIAVGLLVLGYAAVIHVMNKNNARHREDHLRLQKRRRDLNKPVRKKD